MQTGYKTQDAKQGFLATRKFGYYVTQKKYLRFEQKVKHSQCFDAARITSS
jgi:hypothetical protein